MTNPDEVMHSCCLFTESTNWSFELPENNKTLQG